LFVNPIINELFDRGVISATRIHRIHRINKAPYVGVAPE